MLKTKLNLFMSAVIAGSLMASAVHAASDGIKGTSSTGSVDIFLVLKEDIKISGMKDIKVDRKTGNTADTFVYGLTGVCVTSKSETEYTISAGSQNVGQGFFQLAPIAGGGGTGKIDYSLYYTAVTPGSGVNESDVAKLDDTNDNLSQWPGHSLTSSDFRTIATADPNLNCSNGTYNGVLWVKVPDANLSGVTGQYKDTVTVTVSPV